MSGALDLLLNDGVIDAVVGQLKTGKEAEVWLVEQQGQIIAAKIYKERHARNFRNNAGYREGRDMRNSRTRRAVAKGSKFGQEAAEEAWKSAEADSLYKLHAQGVRVPTPVMFYEGVLLMECVVDAEGHPAPRLVEAPPATPQAARELYLDLRAQIIRMLSADLIHGDLSAFNILMAWNGPTIIDFPQTIAAARNNRAEMYFRRDMDNVRNFLAGIDPTLRGTWGDTDEIWTAYTRRDLSPEFVPSGVERAPRPPRQERNFAEVRRDGRDARRGGGGPSGGQAPRNGPPRDDPRRAETGRNGPPRNADNRNGPARNDGARKFPPRNGENGATRDGGRREAQGGNDPSRNQLAQHSDQRNDARRDDPSRNGRRNDGRQNGPPRNDGARGFDRPQHARGNGGGNPNRGGEPRNQHVPRNGERPFNDGARGGGRDAAAPRGNGGNERGSEARRPNGGNDRGPGPQQRGDRRNDRGPRGSGPIVERRGGPVVERRPPPLVERRPEPQASIASPPANPQAPRDPRDRDAGNQA